MINLLASPEMGEIYSPRPVPLQCESGEDYRSACTCRVELVSEAICLRMACFPPKEEEEEEEEEKKTPLSTESQEDSGHQAGKRRHEDESWQVVRAQNKHSFVLCLPPSVLST